MSQNVIYTDGACSKNGAINATGGYGIYLKYSCFGNNIGINHRGESMKITLEGEEETFKVTNIRMEGLAIIASMFLYAEKFVYGKDIQNPVDHLNKYFLKKGHPLKLQYSDSELDQGINTECKSFEVITDSQFWMDVHHKYMPGWIRKKQLLTKARKNKDLVLIWYYYLTLFEQNKVKVNFTHVRSHQKGKRTEHADGNDMADVLATSAGRNKDDLFHQVSV